MEEQASFETRSVLAPRRARLARLALILPAIAIVAAVAAGLSGRLSDPATAAAPDPTTVAAPSPTSEPAFPAQVLGINVRRLDALPRGLGRDEIFAIAGWYVTTSITDCPSVVVIRHDAALPEIRPDVDPSAYCDRSGVLFASRPDPDRREDPGVAAVAVKVALGVRMPPGLETVGTGATELVVLGHFAESAEDCQITVDCSRVLVVDHVGWTPDA
jgi:hypothetical protein